MFCFCLQSSLLKLQALEVEEGSSPESSPEEGPPSLGFEERQGPPALEEKETLKSPCQNQPSEHLDSSTPVHHITDGHTPLPSPRCHSLSHRFNSDPDVAPSPPCSQQYILSRSHERLDAPEEAKDAPSIPLLTRHINTVKKRIRKFEERFEQEMNYKPSHNDKSTHPETLKLMIELTKARRQLKDLKLKQSVFEMKGQTSEENNAICRSGNNQQGALEPQQPHKPTLEETVESLFRRLREKRRALGVPENMKEMSERQMALEKVTLQRCLLYFESLHGRPGTKQERNLVKPLYDRYQTIKHMLCSTTNITTIEEEEGSDEDYIFNFRPVPPPRRLMRALANEEDSDRDSDTAFVSPLDEVKAVRQQPAITMANLHEASRSELLECLRETRKEKKRRSKALKQFEEDFFRQTGRSPQKEDRTPMAQEYQEYKNIKAKLRLLEVLLSKQEVAKTI
ncbi:protein FAM13C [Aplochiton taeniatus]